MTSTQDLLSLAQNLMFQDFREETHILEDRLSFSLLIQELSSNRFLRRTEEYCFLFGRTRRQNLQRSCVARDFMLLILFQKEIWRKNLDFFTLNIWILLQFKRKK